MARDRFRRGRGERAASATAHARPLVLQQLAFCLRAPSALSTSMFASAAVSEGLLLAATADAAHSSALTFAMFFKEQICR